MNPGLDDIKRSTFHYDFDYEHKVAAEYGLGDSQNSQHNSSASSRDLPNLQVQLLQQGWHEMNRLPRACIPQRTHECMSTHHKTILQVILVSSWQLGATPACVCSFPLRSSRQELG